MRVDLSTSISYLKEAEEKIEANLDAGKNATSEIEMRFAARQVTNQMLIKKQLLQKIPAIENKQLEVANILRIIEEKKDPTRQKHSIFNQVDINQLLGERMTTDILVDIKKMRGTDILAS